MSVAAFVRDRVVAGPTLVVPVRVLWWEYLAYCEVWGFAPEDAGGFMRCMVSGDTVRVRDGGRGRLRRCFEGLGLIAGCREGRNRAV